RHPRPLPRPADGALLRRDRARRVAEADRPRRARAHPRWRDPRDGQGLGAPTARRGRGADVSQRYLPSVLVLAAVWGASYPFIKVGVRDLQPPTLMCARLVIAFVPPF